MYHDGGALPRWPIANGRQLCVELRNNCVMQLSSVYSGCMIGNHGYEVILDAYVKDLQNFDVSSAYAAMREEVRREGWVGGRVGGGREGGKEEGGRVKQCNWTPSPFS